MFFGQKGIKLQVELQGAKESTSEISQQQHHPYGEPKVPLWNEFLSRARVELIGVNMALNFADILYQESLTNHLPTKLQH